MRLSRVPRALPPLCRSDCEPRRHSNEVHLLEAPCAPRSPTRIVGLPAEFFSSSVPRVGSWAGSIRASPTILALGTSRDTRTADGKARRAEMIRCAGQSGLVTASRTRRYDARLNTAADSTASAGRVVGREPLGRRMHGERWWSGCCSPAKCAGTARPRSSCPVRSDVPDQLRTARTSPSAPRPSPVRRGSGRTARRPG